MPSSSAHRPHRAMRLCQLIVDAEPLIAVLGGGLVGSAARAGIGHLLPTATPGFPVATLAVNLAGSFLLGAYLARRERSMTVRWSLHFWAIGVLGSFTTFSAFSLDVVHLLEANRPMPAVAYVSVSILGGLLLALSGQRVGSNLR